MNQVLLWLGLKTDSFDAGKKRVIDGARELGHEWHGLRKVFELGGVLGAARIFFGEIIRNAQEARKHFQEMGEPIPATTRAVAELGDATEQVKDILISVPTAVVAGWVMIGQAVGYAINRIRGYSEAEQNMNEASDKALEETEKRIAKAREANSPEKIDQAEKHLAQTRHEEALARASDEDKLNMLMMDNVKLREAVNSTGEHSIEGAKAREALEKNITELVKTEAALRKTEADENKRQGEESLAMYREQVRLDDKRHEQYLDGLSGQEKITALQRDVLDYKREQSKYDKDSLEYAQFEVKIGETNREIKKEQVDLAEQLVKAAEDRKKLEEGIAEAANRTQQAYEAIMFGITNGGHNAEQIQSSSDAALAELKRRNDAQLESLRSNPGDAFHYGNSLSITRLQNENARIQAELDTRNRIRTDVTRFGVEGARRQWQGDPLLFDKLVEQFTQTRTESGKQTQLLQDIKTQLTGGDTGNLPSTFRNLADTVERGLGTIAGLTRDAARRG
ncbi:MAG TPA: hypothetical protein VHD61_15740 [Lacunisphaera sp.]|nr:hypothetical protein [Lacunisphaera sp.]